VYDAKVPVLFSFQQVLLQSGQDPWSSARSTPLRAERGQSRRWRRALHCAAAGLKGPD